MIPQLGDRYLLTTAPEDRGPGRVRLGAARAPVVGRCCRGRPLRLRDTTGPMERAKLYSEFSRAGHLVVKDQAVLETLARYQFIEFDAPVAAARRA